MQWFSILYMVAALESGIKRLKSTAPSVRKDDEHEVGENRTQRSPVRAKGNSFLSLTAFPSSDMVTCRISGCPSSQSCRSTWTGIPGSPGRCSSGSWRAVKPDCRSMLTRRANRSSLPAGAAAVPGSALTFRAYQWPQF